jgi:hypothetical protein
MRYYISWIGRNAEGNVYLIPVSNAFIKFKEASKEVRRIIKAYGKEVVSIWIDLYDDESNKVATLEHQVLIDALGQYTGGVKK